MATEIPFVTTRKRKEVREPPFLLKLPKERTKMWIVKGISYGAIAFLAFGLLFMLKRFPPSSNKAISLGTLRFLTIHNPWFWTVLVLTIITGCAYARWLAE